MPKDLFITMQSQIALLNQLGGMIGGMAPAYIAPNFEIKGDKELIAYCERIGKTLGTSNGRWLRIVANHYRDYLKYNMISGQRLKVRSGRLRSAWRVEKRSENEFVVGPGMLPYSRIHEGGLDEPEQFVRPHTRGGIKIGGYFRHMVLRPRRYVSQTVKYGYDGAEKKLTNLFEDLLKKKGPREQEEMPSGGTGGEE